MKKNQDPVEAAEAALRHYDAARDAGTRDWRPIAAELAEALARLARFVENADKTDFMCQALNEGDGTYRP